MRGVSFIYINMYIINRRTTCEALVLPDAEDILLGAIPPEALDLTINPQKEEVVGAHGDQILHRV